MDLILTFLLITISLAIGVIGTLAVQWYFFNVWLMCKPYVGPPDKPMSSQFRLPQNLIDALQSSDVPKKESCLALNLLFQFLFKEIRNAEKVRHWFRQKLSQEFEELLTRTTTGKLFDKVRIRDLHLGMQFPAIKSITIKDAVVNPEHQHIDNLDLCLDLEYTGGFQLSIDANMLLGKAAFLSVKVNHLSGLGRLQFTRHPYTHWSFTFYNEPVLELQVESQFQGRHLSQITTLITSQIRRALRKKHTFPNYKLRYKPFFVKSEPGEEDSTTQPITAGNLEVTVVEVTRLMQNLAIGEIYCSLAVDSTAWVEMVQSETSSLMTLDLIVAKPPTQALGIVFKQEFVAERYAACVIVETVLPLSPAAFADIRKGDILAAVEGKKVTSMSHVARLVKAAGDRFVLRVERKSSYKLQPSDVDVEKELPQEKDRESLLDLNTELKMEMGDGIRQRHGSFAEKTESESSNSNPASLPGSPAKTSLILPRSLQSSPEKVLRANFHRNSSTSMDGEEEIDYLQILKTKRLPADQVLPFNEALMFSVAPKHRYVNVSVWSKAMPPPETDGGGRTRTERDKLVAHVSLPLGTIAAQCGANPMGHFLKSYTLLPPDSQTDINRGHRLWGHSGFEPCLCFGDILLSFLYTGSAGSVGPGVGGVSTPLEPPPTAVATPVEDSRKQHDFVRTHFNRTTQCEFCAKKIWLKDAVQCRDCALTCHKKCVGKCQLGTVCVPGSAARRPSVPAPDDSLAPSTESSPRRPSVHPEIITTAATDDGTTTPQGHRRRIGNLLASVTSAAQARGLKRAGSANNLALPYSSDASSQSRSLPPSPQHSPAVSRKASLVGNQLQFGNAALDAASADEMSAVLSRLMEQPHDDDLMSVAKDTGKDLYAGLPLSQRKDKVNHMISKLKTAMDVETTSRMNLAKEEQGTKESTQRAKLAFLIGKSDEKVQALAVLMLHFCSGLQHIQDQEDIATRKADLGLLDEDLTIEITQ